MNYHPYQDEPRRELFATARQVLTTASQLLINTVGERSLLDYFDVRPFLLAKEQDDPSEAFYVPTEGFMARGNTATLLEVLLQDADLMNTMGVKEKARVASGVNILGGVMLRNWEEVCTAADAMEEIITDAYGQTDEYFLYGVGSEKITLFNDPDFGQIAKTIIITPQAKTSHVAYRIEGRADTIPSQYLSRACGDSAGEASLICKVTVRLQMVSEDLGSILRSS